VLLTKYYLGDKIENKMGRTYSTYGEGSGAYTFWWEKLKEKGHLEDPGVDRSILLRWIFKK